MLKPQHDFVLIRPSDPETFGRIYVPSGLRDDTSNRNDYIRKWNQWCYGEVVAVGPGARRRTRSGKALQGRVPVDLKPGQRIYYKRAEATDIPEDASGESGLVMVHAESIAFEVKSDG